LANLRVKLNVMQISERIPAILILAISTVICHAAPLAETPMMKGVVAHEYGAPDVLKFEDVPRPEPKENEALMRVIASGVNPADPLTLSGKYAKGIRHADGRLDRVAGPKG